MILLTATCRSVTIGRKTVLHFYDNSGYTNMPQSYTYIAYLVGLNDWLCTIWYRLINPFFQAYDTLSTLWALFKLDPLRTIVNKSSVFKWMALYLQIYILSIVKMWDMAKSICQCYFDTSSWFSEMNVLYAKELLLLLLLLLSHWHIRVITIYYHAINIHVKWIWSWSSPRTAKLHKCYQCKYCILINFILTVMWHLATLSSGFVTQSFTVVQISWWVT